MNISLVRAQILRIVAIAAITLGSFASASPVSAQAVYHGFVKDEYYLGRNGTPATLEQVATSPLSVFRSRTAYETLKTHMSGYLGKILSDEEFRALLVSDDVRLVPCVGRIDTAGISDAGRVGWRERACYQGESLIQMRIRGTFVTVASQGCFNPVRGAPLPPIETSVLLPPPPPPIKRVTHCHVVEVPFENGPDYVISTPGQLVQVRCGNQMLWLPGLSVNTGGSTGAAYKLVCHEVDEQALSSEGH